MHAAIQLNGGILAANGETPYVQTMVAENAADHSRKPIELVRHPSRRPAGECERVRRDALGRRRSCARLAVALAQSWGVVSHQYGPAVPFRRSRSHINSRGTKKPALFDEFPKYPHQGKERQRKDHRADIGETCKVDRGVRKSQPEKAHRAERSHAAGLAR